MTNKGSKCPQPGTEIKDALIEVLEELGYKYKLDEMAQLTSS